jgi:hypothetical protein
MSTRKFDPSKLKGKLAGMQRWFEDKHIPPRLLFFIMGILSTIWFFVRVIPKPSRAAYPCMRVAAPFMSGFIIYLISLGGITLFLRKALKSLENARFRSAISLFAGAILFFGISLTSDVANSTAQRVN